MSSIVKKICASLVYGFMGLLLFFFNKIILTTYMFPNYFFMGLMQSIMITGIFRILKAYRLVNFADFSWPMVRQLFPIPLFYFVNLLTGLGATKFISAPMFVVLRRFSIPLTLLLQYRMLGMRYSRQAMFAIAILMLGSFFAMFEDFSFSFWGYFLCLANDFGDSFESVLTKKQLNTGRRVAEQKTTAEDMEQLLEDKQASALSSFAKEKSEDEEIEIGKAGILYYSALFNIVPLFIFAYLSGDLVSLIHFDGWIDFKFSILFVVSLMLSVLFLYTWITCTDLNSPLLSQIVSSLRSILITYVGMYVGGDYIFNMYNFIGLNISMVGAIYYTYVNFKDERRKSLIQSNNIAKLPSKKQGIA